MQSWGLWSCMLFCSADKVSISNTLYFLHKGMILLNFFHCVKQQSSETLEILKDAHLSVVCLQ